MKDRLIVKVGGSLFDWPELPDRLRAWLSAQRPAQVLLVPGGGRTADVVRDLDRTFHLGEEAAHWLALRSLTLNAHFLTELLGVPVVASWQNEEVAILDAHAFCLADEGHLSCLPHSWQVTSDSVAARVAQVFGATRLVLMKSVDIPGEVEWARTAEEGLVDAYFSRAAQEIMVTTVNLRTWANDAGAFV